MIFLIKMTLIFSRSWKCAGCKNVNSLLVLGKLELTLLSNYGFRDQDGNSNKLKLRLLNSSMQTMADFTVANAPLFMYSLEETNLPFIYLLLMANRATACMNFT